MKEIEIEEHVRTTDGRIYKVVDIDNIFIYVDKEVKYIEETNTSIDYIKKSSVVKHSKNIIDLIEVGDYVNGYKVISIDTNAPNDCKECIELDRNNTYEYQWISRNEIETILTKEQYQANCYTVERKE